MLPLLLRMMPLLIQVEIVLTRIITIISMIHTTINTTNMFIAIHQIMFIFNFVHQELLTRQQPLVKTRESAK